jgi:hypothetical protein
VSNYEKCSDEFKKRVLTQNQNKREQPESMKMDKKLHRVSSNVCQTSDSTTIFNPQKYPIMMRTNKRRNDLK